jgi:diguanylate cyclase
MFRAMARILVIDDEAEQRDHIAGVLRASGHQVQAVSSGKEALASLGAAPPALVVCDLMMPDMDGAQVLEKVRADPSTSTVPFIFLTAMRFPGGRDEAKGMGAQGVLVKPFTAQALNELVEKLLKPA